MLIDIRPRLEPVDAEAVGRRAVVVADGAELRVWDIDSRRPDGDEVCWARRYDSAVPLARLAAWALRAAGELWVHGHGEVDLARRWDSDAWRRLARAEREAASGDLAGRAVPASTAPLFGR